MAETKAGAKPEKDAKAAKEAAPPKSPAKKPAQKKVAPPVEETLEEEELEEEDLAREGEEEAPPEKPAKKAPKRALAEAEESGEEGEEEAEDEEAGKKKKKSAPRPSPQLDSETTKALVLRRAKNAARPHFIRQEGHRYARLGDTWRAPQGIQSKMRRHWRTHPDVVSIGYRGPRAARGLHPSGFREVLVYNEDSLDGVDPKTEAVRIASSVGSRKRARIQKDAKKRGIRVLNWRQI
jgi:large subunit ribosomal protein L32e